MKISLLKIDLIIKKKYKNQLQKKNIRELSRNIIKM